MIQSLRPPYSQELQLLASEKWTQLFKNRAKEITERWYCVCVYICLRVSFHQERGHDVTRFVTPQCNVDCAGWDQSEGVRGEGSYCLWKIPQSPKDGCQGNRGEDGYWTTHHFYCQLLYQCTTAGGAKATKVESGFWQVMTCLLCDKNPLHNPVADNHCATLSYLQRPADLIEMDDGSLLTLALNCQTAIIILDTADFRPHLDKWRALIFEGSHVWEW